MRKFLDWRLYGLLIWRHQRSAVYCQSPYLGEGQGSRGSFCGIRTLYVGKRKTTVKDRKKEIGKGLLAKMLGDLGIARDDLEAAERRKRL